MQKEKRMRKEQKALRISLVGVVFFVVLALGFAIFTKSDAILFDGIYSLISFATALLTMRVAKLAERPDDDQFHFGYTTLEPTLNLFKSLITIVVCVYAAVEATQRLLAGGTEAAYGWAVVYGCLATSGCFVVALLLRKYGRDCRSDLVNVESKAWFVDSLLSASVLLGFLFAWGLTKTEYAHWAPYVDPILLIGIILLALPIPGRIFLDSLREIIVMAPPESVVDEIGERLRPTLAVVPHELIEYRVNKRGRNTYLLVHVLVAADFKLQSIEALDDIRRESSRQMKAWNPEIVMDVLFVRDKSLIY
ncbi:cation diffusion facilitator family transporter [Simiduia aestuariiviva]|uniref:Cation diffusion facilitator family transporter n=1 Tax=Simiduia aestuariiviva TaxID=1510459 RepID=A0A839UFS9_9GAMM|nr:cation diffusion facilitator family transporter [Simiduia aestuariiviva]MBB3166894.1 cation diffusion facilitator family transporter [Simiduia aestuariiviva]